MENIKLCAATRLNWGEAAYHLGKFISEILKREVHCCAIPDGTEQYWGLNAVNTTFSLEDFKILLAYVRADEETYNEAMPDDSKDSKSLGQRLSEALLEKMIGSSWEHLSVTEDGIWLIGIDRENIIIPEISSDILMIDNAAVEMRRLLPKADLIEKLQKADCSCSSLSELCNQYVKLFGNELYWQYPITDGEHYGVYLILVREGILSIPYSNVDSLDEKFCMDKAKLCDMRDMSNYLSNWKQFSGYTSKILDTMVRFLYKREE